MELKPINDECLARDKTGIRCGEETHQLSHIIRTADSLEGYPILCNFCPTRIYDSVLTDLGGNQTRTDRIDINVGAQFFRQRLY